MMWSSKQMLQQELGLTLTLIYEGSWNDHVLCIMYSTRSKLKIWKHEMLENKRVLAGFLAFGQIFSSVSQRKFKFEKQD